MKTAVLLALLALFSPRLASSESAWPAPRGGEPTGGESEFKDPLKVKGQTRNLNMMLLLKSKEDKIKFIKVRKNFRKEILNTQY